MDVSIKSHTLQVLELAQWMVKHPALEIIVCLKKLHTEGFPQFKQEKQTNNKTGIKFTLVRLVFPDGELHVALYKNQCVTCMLIFLSVETLVYTNTLCKERYAPFMNKYWLNQNVQISFVRQNTLAAAIFNEIMYNEYSDENLLFSGRYMN